MIKKYFLKFIPLLPFLFVQPLSSATIIIPPNPGGTVNGGTEDDLIIIQKTGSVPGDVHGQGGSNTIIIENGGGVQGNVIGGLESSFNYLSNAGIADQEVWGAENVSNGSIGGNSVLTNTGFIGSHMAGSVNVGDYSSGYSNTLRNSGYVEAVFFGSVNAGDGSHGGSNRLTSTSTGNVGEVHGSFNFGDGSNGGSNVIFNSGYVDLDIIGSYNWGADSFGGSNYIENDGNVEHILGSANTGSSSFGGNNTIINRGVVRDSIFGSWNATIDESGGGNTIYNYGTVVWDIVGSAEAAAGAVSSGNTIYNYGWVGNDIVGGNGNDTIYNHGYVDDDLEGEDGNDHITNTGTVGDNIRGGDGNDTIYNHSYVGDDIDGQDGDDHITNSGTVANYIRGGDGNDTVVMQNGPENVGELIDGGADTDTIVYSGGTWTQNNPKVVNFELTEINATHNLTLRGPWDIGESTAYVNGGTLNVPDTLVAHALIINSGRANIDGSLWADYTKNWGTLMVNGTLNSRLYNYGFLGGSGRVVGDVFNSGTISPGNSIGTLTIHGNYSHSPGALYIAEISASGRSDLIDISGRAVIKGGTVRTRLPRALYAEGDDWRILKAGGGITGRFARIDGQPQSATLILDLAYSATTASLFVERKPYSEFGESDNQKAIGGYLDRSIEVVQGSGDSLEKYLVSLDFDHSAKQITEVLSEINPEMYTAFSTSSRISSAHFTDNIRKRVLQQNEINSLGLKEQHSDGSESMVKNQDENMGEDPLRRGWQIWGRGFGGASDSSRSGYEGFSQKSTGLILGGDGQVFPALRFGLAIGSSKSDLDFDSSDSGEQKSFLTGVYGDLNLADFYGDFSLTYGWHYGNAQRVLNLPTIGYNVLTDIDSTSVQIHAGGEYLFEKTSLSFGPTLALDYVSVSTDGFAEQTGSMVDLSIEDSRENHLISRVGGKVASLFEIGTTKVLPRIEMAWLHDFNDGENELTANFTGYEDSTFNVIGTGVPADLLNLEAGVTTHISQRFAAYLEFAANFGENYSDYIVSIGAEWEF